MMVPVIILIGVIVLIGVRAKPDYIEIGLGAFSECDYD